MTTQLRFRRIALVRTLLWATACFSTQSNAATLTVVSSADNNNPSTLRSAIAQANPLGGDIINFAPALNGSTFTLIQGELVINKDLTISGPGATQLSIVNGNGRVFHIELNNNNNNAPSHVQISGLRLQGKTSGADGTANTPAGQPAQGGAILNDASCVLTLRDCDLDSCQAIGGRGFSVTGPAFGPPASGGAGGGAGGGAIYSAGDLLLFGCTFYNDSATGGNGGDGFQGGSGGGGGLAQGGAVYQAYNGADLAIVNCTFFANAAYGGYGGNGGDGYRNPTEANPANGGPGGDGGPAQGGGIYVVHSDIDNTGLIHSTVDQNACFPGGGGQGGSGVFGGDPGAPGANGSAQGCGLYTAGMGIAALPVGDAIFAQNYSLATAHPAGPDVWGEVSSHKYSLIGVLDANSSGWIAGFELSGTVALPLDPRLGSLQFNGGQTQTMAPMAGSPAIDAGDQGGFPLDQAGQPRPVILIGAMNGGDGSDIGAYELQSAPTNSPLTITITPTATNTLLIAWPAPSTGFVLQENPTLGSSGWNDTTYTVNTVGTQKQVVVFPVFDQHFFRLFHP